VTAEGEITGAVEIFSDRSSLANSFDRVNSLERMSAVDRQMGIANRRYSEAHLRARIQEGFSFGISLGLLFIKIDHFHRISETYGREIGTRVLRTVAETLIYNLRPFDFIGRWDNEAVVVMLSNVHEDGLLERADNLRMLVERSVLMVGKPIRVTVSIGATLIQPGDNLETWVERANALSEAHGGGGHNKVILG
jgi:diguanylate cyclase (GGDEF)-like protein